MVVLLVVALGLVALGIYGGIWRVRMGLWTKRDTMEIVVSIVSSVVGSLLGLKLFGFI